MQLTDVQNTLKRQDTFKRRETVTISREINATTVVLRDITHETVISQRNHRLLLQSNKDLEILSDKC